jgi:hypothetical protein
MNRELFSINLETIKQAGLQIDWGGDLILITPNGDGAIIGTQVHETTVKDFTAPELLSALGAKLAGDYEDTQKQLGILTCRLDEARDLAETSAKANLEREKAIAKLAGRVEDLDSQWADADLPNVAEYVAKITSLDSVVGRIFKRIDEDESGALELKHRISKLEVFDYTEEMQSVLNDLDFSECRRFSEHVEAVIEDYDFHNIVTGVNEDQDFTDDIRSAVHDFDFSRQISDAVRAEMDDLDFTDYRSFTRAVENEVSEQVADAVLESLRCDRAVDIITDTINSVLDDPSLGVLAKITGINQDINALEEVIEIYRKDFTAHVENHPVQKQGVITAEEIREALVGRTLTVTIA